MTIETITKITIDMLTTDSVSILKQEFAELNGVQQQIGQNFRCAYVNSPSDRERLLADLEEQYAAAVMQVWGDTPTVEDPVPVVDNLDKQTDETEETE